MWVVGLVGVGACGGGMAETHVLSWDIILIIKLYAFCL